MKKIRQSRNKIRKTGLPALVLFLCGFLAGTLVPNILWRMEWQQKTMASIYLICAFADRGVSGTEYLKEVLRMRGSVYFLCAVCGFSVFGAPLAVIGVFLLGTEIGALLAMSILQFGFAGGMLGIGLLFPQYLVYIPVTLAGLARVYDVSLGIWKNKGLFPRKVGGYTLEIFLGAVLYSGGILLECYVNPWIVEKILELTDFF